MPKKICFFFDGTSNEIDGDHPTNVLIASSGTANKSKDLKPQMIFYKKGVGTKVGDRSKAQMRVQKFADWSKEKIYGATGKGLYNVVLQAYEDLCFNYEVGDEIYVFGFSRGAYTARSFCGFIQHNGITKRLEIEKVLNADEEYRRRGDDSFKVEGPEARAKRFLSDTLGVPCTAEDQAILCGISGRTPEDHPIISIKYLGVWDTVKTITTGHQDEDGHRFHIDGLVPIVESSRHAIAADEYREEFDVTPFDNVEDRNHAAFTAINNPKQSFEDYLQNDERAHQQSYFPGTHGSVGGGGDERGLSDEALLWVVEGAKHAGLRIDVNMASKVFTAKPDFTAPLDNTSEFSLLEKAWAVKSKHIDGHVRIGPKTIRDVSGSLIRRVAHSMLDEVDPDDIYNPGSMTNVWGDIKAEAKTFTNADRKLSFHASGEVAPTTIRSVEDKKYYVHQVQSGEYLNKLSKRFYGTTKRQNEIMAANRFDIIDADRIQVGQLINIPVLEGFKTS